MKKDTFYRCVKDDKKRVVAAKFSKTSAVKAFVKIELKEDKK